MPRSDDESGPYWRQVGHPLHPHLELDHGEGGAVETVSIENGRLIVKLNCYDPDGVQHGPTIASIPLGPLRRILTHARGWMDDEFVD